MMDLQGNWTEEDLNDKLTTDVNVVAALQDMTKKSTWITHPEISKGNTTACVRSTATGVFQIGYNETCDDPLATLPSPPVDNPMCEYDGCYTLEGQQCVFPFKYINTTDDGTVLEANYTKCTTQDIYKPWCPTALKADGDILTWGLCLPSCPQEVAEIVCLDEPPFPDFVYAVHEAEGYRNFTSNYEYKSQDIMGEMDVSWYACPEGYHFEGSHNVTQYALCHNWQWVAEFDQTAMCTRECPTYPPSLFELFFKKNSSFEQPRTASARRSSPTTLSPASTTGR